MSRRSRRRDPSPRSIRLTLVSAITVVSGLVYLMVGMAQLLQPEWYFANLAPFEPYNRPDIGLAGSLMLPLGVVMIIASQNPSQGRLVIGMGASAAVLMVFSAWYGAAAGEFAAADHGLLVMALIGLALAQMWAFWQIRPRMR
jgi:hypothetical protein